MGNWLSTKNNKINELINKKNPPIKFKFNKCISKDSHINLPFSSLNAYIDDAFCLFKSIDNKIFLIFSHTFD